MQKPAGQFNLCLSDFVAPKDSGGADYLGGFVVTGGIGADALAKQFSDAHDDYNAILVKALADRLAEAFAASLHAKARAEWGLDDVDENNICVVALRKPLRKRCAHVAGADYSDLGTHGGDSTQPPQDIAGDAAGGSAPGGT